MEKLYKQWVVVHHLIQVDNDVTFGDSTPRTLKYFLEAIVLPETNTREHLYNAGYLSATRNFTYGALLDEVAVPVIIKNARLYPQLTTNDWVIVGTQRYNFKKVEFTMDGKSYHILTQQTPSTQAVT